jgi:prepilin signal peptidase PulO-like enzyme (type II secretory pathway)
VEAATGIGFVLAFWRIGLDWPLLVAWAFIAVMITVALIDHDHMIIPDKIVLPGALLGLGAAIAVDPQGWWTYLAGSLGAATFMFLLVMLWPGGMGPGDVKMALLMAAAGVFLLATRRRTRKDQIPFGPYLGLGGIVAVLAGQSVLQSYIGLFS